MVVPVDRGTLGVRRVGKRPAPSIYVSISKVSGPREPVLSWGRRTLGYVRLSLEKYTVKRCPNRELKRRDFLGIGLAGATSTIVALQVPASGPALQQDHLKSKRRARYQPNSQEIRNFYRVNRYPAR